MKPSELLSSEMKWTKGCFARDKTGTPVNYNDIGVVCFCLLGAVLHCGITEIERFHLTQACNRRRRIIGIAEQIVAFNDHPDTTYKDVIDVLKEVGL